MVTYFSHLMGSKPDTVKSVAFWLKRNVVQVFVDHFPVIACSSHLAYILVFSCKNLMRMDYWRFNSTKSTVATSALPSCHCIVQPSCHCISLGMATKNLSRINVQAWPSNVTWKFIIIRCIAFFLLFIKSHSWNSRTDWERICSGIKWIARKG